MKNQLKRLRAAEDGFTLIELLIAIVVVGILTAVVIVGIGGLTDNGEAAACDASRDAAQAATAVFYANTDGTYPATLTAMTAPATGQPMLVLPSGGTSGAMTYTINGWTLTMTPGASGAAPTFACS